MGKKTKNVPNHQPVYLQNSVIFRVNVGKYSIHGAFGYGNMRNRAESLCRVELGDLLKTWRIHDPWNNRKKL